MAKRATGACLYKNSEHSSLGYCKFTLLMYMSDFALRVSSVRLFKTRILNQIGAQGTLNACTYKCIDVWMYKCVCACSETE